jgi:hypothetical protein
MTWRPVSCAIHAQLTGTDYFAKASSFQSSFARAMR